MTYDVQRYAPWSRMEPLGPNDDVTAPDLYVLAADAEAHERAAVEAAQGGRLVTCIFHAPDDGPRAFALVRTTDVSGVSGTGTVAYGVEFPDGTVALRWVGSNPTSVVFHDNGMKSVEAVHGHGGATSVMWLSEDLGPRAAEMDECERRAREQAIRDCIAAVEAQAKAGQGQAMPGSDWVHSASVLAALRALLEGEKP